MVIKPNIDHVCQEVNKNFHFVIFVTREKAVFICIFQLEFP